MLREDAIYLAGLFDGEGCVQFHRRYRRVRKGRNPHYALTCTLDISMTDKPTIDHVRKITGVGSVNIYWDDAAENSSDVLTGYYDFEGYKIYKSKEPPLFDF